MLIYEKNLLLRLGPLPSPKVSLKFIYKVLVALVVAEVARDYQERGLLG